LRIVAREAAGSMRDAMSLLDQVIAWIGGSGETLTAEGVARVLGVASRSVLHNIGAAVLGGQPARCIEIVGALAEQGFSLGNVARDLLRYLRDLVVASVSDEPSRLIDLADAELGELVTLAKTTTSEDLSRLYLGFSRSFDDIVRSSQPRGALEMALVRLSQRPPLLPLDELLRKLAAMEKRLAGGGGPAAGGAAGAGHSNRGGAGPIPGGPRAQATSSPQPVPPPPQPPPSQGPPAPAAASPPPPQPAPPPPQPPPSQGPSAPAPAVTPAPAPAARRPPAKKEDKPLFTPPARFAAAAAATPTSSGKAPSPAAAAAGRGPAQRPPAVTAHPFEHVTNKHVSAPPPGSAAAVAPAAAARNAEQVKEWQTLLNRFPAEKKHIAGYFQQAAPLAVAADGVTIAFAATAEFAAQQVNNNDAMHLLQTAVNEHFGAVTAVTIVADADLRGMQTVTEKLALEKQLRIDQARQQVAQHPVVLAAMEVLGAELRDVRLPAATGAP
ncbi:MAG TPA: DNA polymerase III subunit gamma/tau, partial [Sorangium sp.]|nr:DNA polymerase III subunit gamma/tau [Sorangium sp.]